jgi:ABC-type lipoprotein release transport system permease subunit
VVPKSHQHVITVLLFTVCTLMIMVALAVCCYRNFIRSELPRDMVGKVGEIIANYASNLSAQKKKKKERMVEEFEEEL